MIPGQCQSIFQLISDQPMVVLEGRPIPHSVARRVREGLLFDLDGGGDFPCCIPYVPATSGRYSDCVTILP